MLDRSPTHLEPYSASKTILIVDDTPTNLRLLAKLLTSQGYAVRQALSGRLALKAIQESLPDLILLDIRMPEMDGYEVCRQLKAIDRTRKIPIIFLSALQKGSETAKAFEVGGVDYITKPFHAEEVIARVRHQLQLLELQHQLQQQQQSLVKQNQQLQQEICDRTATEDHLNRMTSRLSTLIRNLQAGILVANEHQEIVLANYTFCRLFEMKTSPKALMGADCIQLVAQSKVLFTQPDQTLQRLNLALDSRQPSTAEEQLANGRILEWDYAPIISGTHFQGHLWQLRDITARRANEQALLKTSQTLTTFSNSLKQLHRLSLKQFDTFDDLAEDYLKTGRQILNFAGGVIGFLRGERYVAAAVQSGPEGIPTNFDCHADETFCYKAMCTRKTVTYPHIGSLPEMREHPLYQAFALESCISTPILVDDKVYGSLSFFSTEPRNQGFTGHEAEIVELMAQSIGKFITAHRTEQQRKQSAIALRESEARFRQLAERIENVFWILEPSQRQFTYISPAFETIWGRSCAEILNTPHAWRSAIRSDNGDRIVAKQFRGEGYDEEYRIARPDGTIRWIRDRAFPIHDAAGHAYRLVGIAEDITDFKHQEQALRLIFEGTAAKTGSEFFRYLVRYLAEVLQVRYAVVNQKISHNRVRSLAFWQDGQFMESFEYSLKGTPCEQVLARQTLFYSTNIRDDYPHHPDFIAWNIDSYFGTPLTSSSGHVIGSLSVLDDQPMLPSKSRELILKIFAARAGAELERQTFENEIQQAREIADSANRAKSEFLANVSHELRTPLNAILGFTQLILSEARVDAKTREYLDIVSRSGTHLLALINDVLEMSKIEAGKVALHKQSFDLQALLHSLESLFSLRAQAKALQLIVECDPDLPHHIETDESKLRQVLINLLGNAVKFTQSGRVILRVKQAAAANIATSSTPSLAITLASVPLRSHRLMFEVEDTGPGITLEEVETLFDPFIQTASGRQSQEGTGLGLPISQRFVQLMGGELKVKTIPGQGSTFSFTIETSPVMPTEKKTRPSENLTVERVAPNQPEYRFLVVEDQPANRLLLVRLLGTAGFSVRVAEDGAAAVEQATLWKPHLIWMDIRMPVMDGYEATRRIKAAGLEPSPIIIAITASAFEEERVQAMAAGCDDFVRKPFKIEQIFQKIGQHLQLEYLYRTDSTTPSETIDETIVTADLVKQGKGMLREMPQGWLQALHQAAIKGSDDYVLQLVKFIPQQHSTLAQVLTHFAHNFQFETMLDMLEGE